MNQKDLEDLFSDPVLTSLQQNLTPHNFEEFVSYVFFRAGYVPKNVAFKFLRGVDLELYSSQQTSRRMGGVEVKRFGPTTMITLDIVQKLLGAAALNNGKIPGYLVTTTNKVGKDAATLAGGRNAYIVNGDTFIRYIKYIQGSSYINPKSQAAYIPPEPFLEPEKTFALKPSTTRIITITNNKGGVGKTTTARFIAEGFAAKGDRVLLVDFDAQGNTSERYFGNLAGTLTIPTLTQYFASEKTLTEIVRPVPNFTNLSILPAHPDMIFLDTGGYGRPKDELQFARDLFSFLDTSPPMTFDWIIIDTPPAVSYYTRVAFACADYALFPMRARPSSVAGTVNALGVLQTMQHLTRREVGIIGGVFTHWADDTETQQSAGVLGQIFFNNNAPLLSTVIPFDQGVERGSLRANSRAKVAYEELLKEILNYVNDTHS
ncbi:MAG: AAA family ATPase [Ktedonobacteraceae bacterium]|nr:AAA family ATPase [Ktedonobacteraceae bacterium]MBA3825277.1 AAA family ATPase [Ktedonobacterales bacterium]